ncbi:MAG: M67 family metallopeptidase [Aquificae bacterium]|nr:M67 family metallopeptidase [Aquificota bacterium]
MLRIKKELIHQIEKQGEEGYPYEICGFILGEIDYENDLRTAVEVVQVENQNKERANDRFEIHPKDYLRVERYADEKGIQIIGIYHTHPDHPDRPSETDLRFAQPDMSYIIMSVKNGKASDWRSWKLEGSGFVQEEVEII